MIASLVILSGLLIGSFFNVLIWRIPRNESIVFPASHCPKCNRKIKPWENIPVISYLFLRGRCAGCHERISVIYPLIELSTALLALFLWRAILPYQLPAWPDLIYIITELLFLLLILPMAIIDIKHFILPDSFTITLLVLSFGVSFIPGNITPLRSLLGIVAGGGSLWLIGILGSFVFRKEETMGGGDIKLMAAAGALWGPEIALMSIIFGALLGSIVGIPLLLFKKQKFGHQIPFGPYLGAGLYIAVFSGYMILISYMNLIDTLFQPK